MDRLPTVPKNKKPGTVLAVLLIAAAIVYAASRMYPSLPLFSFFISGHEPVPVAPRGSDLHARLEAAAQKLDLVRDPFSAVPVVPVSAQQAQGVDVKGIFWDAGRPMAIVNESVVRIGDVVNNMTVVDIQKDRVILQQDGQYLELRVNIGR